MMNTEKETLLDMSPYDIIKAMQYEPTEGFLRRHLENKEFGFAVYDPVMVENLASQISKKSLSQVDKFFVLEQEFFAALNLGKNDVAEKILNEIFQKFSPNKSSRALLFKGLLFEGKGKYEEASKIYLELSNDSLVSSEAKKRIIAINLAEGDRREAIENLVTYLETMSRDKEAWVQLTKLYMYEGMYSNAMFCYEELILMNSNNHVLCARYADILFTLNQYNIALMYYCKSLCLFPDYLKALYGLYKSAQYLLSVPIVSLNQSKGSKKTKQVPNNVKYDEDTLKKLVRISTNRLNILYCTRGCTPSKSTARVFFSWLNQENITL